MVWGSTPSRPVETPLSGFLLLCWRPLFPFLSFQHVEGDFWAGFQTAAGVFTMGEALEGGESGTTKKQRVKVIEPRFPFSAEPMILKEYQKLKGMDSVLNYATYYAILSVVSFFVLFHLDPLFNWTDPSAFAFLRRAFSSVTSKVVELNNMLLTVRYWFPDSTLLGSFVGNHDGEPRQAAARRASSADVPSSARDPSPASSLHHFGCLGEASLANPTTRS
jgi:hypothetical protein